MAPLRHQKSCDIILLYLTLILQMMPSTKASFIVTEQ